MSDGDMIADNRGKLVTGDMNNRAILHVGMMPDANGKNIAAQDTIEPYARLFANLHVADDVRAVFDKGASGDLRQNTFEGINHKIYLMIRMRAAQGQWQREEFTTEA